MKQLCVVILFLFSSLAQSQIVSMFTWDANPVTTASIGPNATSIGSSATSATGGVGGTNGLNPGLPTADINMVIPNTGNIFDMNNIDISIDYRRNESVATMFRRGTFISNNGANNFRMTYRVVTGTVVTTVTSSNIAIPQDNTFRNYRFTYDNCSGTGRMYVNNSVVWTSSPLTPGQNLYWVGDGNFIIGQDMDGASNNIPNLDNFIVRTYSCSTLPIELLSFSGTSHGSKNLLKWSTATEKDNRYFSIENSTDGLSWTEVKRVDGAGNSVFTKNYATFIEQPASTINYYRLTQIDFNGESEKFQTIAIDNSESSEKRPVKMFDPLGREVNDTYKGVVFLYYSDGSVLKTLSE